MYNINELLSNEKILNHAAKQTFDSLDTDGSGKITTDELHLILCSIAKDIGYRPPSMEETQLILKEIDTDNSGELEIDEFTKLFKKLLHIIKEA